LHTARAPIPRPWRHEGRRTGDVSLLHQMAVDVWQLHRSVNQGVENFAAERIVNFDERTAHWVKLTATQDGPFTITNGRTGVTKAYVSTAKQ